ncbi:hypothetical protein [Acidovorax sp. FJL06]|uniref:hypothetical protein n=1 Tax=Acidovorax sp. FJL06 TaxID=2153365 RepID=UPI000F571DC2|nr:hypothetical protein [Acidovorax sp. FJL06]
MRYFVDLPTFLQRALVLRTPHGAAPLRPAQRAAAPLVGCDPGGDALQAVAGLDGHTLWPTHRIRCCLHGQPWVQPRHRSGR